TCHTTTTPHASTTQTGVLHRTETGRQSAVVGQRLTFATLVGAFAIRLFRQPQAQHECHHHVSIQFFPPATAQIFRQTHIPKPSANQTADRHTHRFKHTAHFTVTAFMNSDAIPTVAAFATQKFDHAELG